MNFKDFLATRIEEVLRAFKRWNYLTAFDITATLYDDILRKLAQIYNNYAVFIARWNVLVTFASILW